MFESLKCLCWSWDPILQTAAQRTVLPLCGKATLTETVCVWVLKLALQLKRPGVPGSSLPSSGITKLEHLVWPFFLLSGQL